MAIGTQQTGIPNASETGETGATIQIEQLANRAAVVRVTYPDDRRRKDVKVLRIVCSCLCLVPIIAWLFVRNGAAGWFAVVISALGVSYVITNMLRQFSAITRSYVLRADHSGLTIETWNGRRATSQHFTRGQITDIVLGFSFYKGPNSLFSCWLVIDTPFSSKIRCLQNLGGNHLGRIADVLRTALGMPTRSWP